MKIQNFRKIAFVIIAIISTQTFWGQTTPPNPNPPPPGLPIDGFIGAGILVALLLGVFYHTRIALPKKDTFKK